jgi:hypothetical protein
MTTLFRTATEYVANELTLTRGTVSDIVSVGVYMNTDPAIVPTVAQFTTVSLISPTTTPASPLLDGTKIDVVSKIGPGGGAVTAGHFPSLTAGDYQRWVLITTADEHIIRRPDVVTIS